MDAITMVKTNSLADRLRNDFPEFHFEPSDDFRWNPNSRTICLTDIHTPFDALTLLHEVAHACLSHTFFTRDIDLLKMERAAWSHARDVLAPRYGIDTNEDDVEDMLDTYRDWLHARSSCPSCSMTGVQSAESHYRCLSCSHAWRVNDARRCGLRRYTLA